MGETMGVKAWELKPFHFHHHSHLQQLWLLCRWPSSRAPRQATITIRACSKQSDSFIKPLSAIYPLAPCRFCRGKGILVCESCDGKGVLGKGGYHVKNRVDIPRIIGSKWTAMEKTFGWRHFEVASKQKEGNDWFLQLVATCDQNTRFWLNAQNLKDRKRWSMGWLQKEQIFAAWDSGITCKACKGAGRLSCKACGDEKISMDIINV